jgi:Protein of unknown function (DUF1272)
LSKPGLRQVAVGADLVHGRQALTLFGGAKVALELRPNCEYCDKDLPANAPDARI